MYSTRFTKLALSLILFSALMLAEKAYAQDSAMRVIPVQSKGYRVAFSPDGQMAAIFEDSIIYGDEPNPLLYGITLLNVETGQSTGVLYGMSDYTTDAVFTPDGKQLISYTQNGYLHVWDVSGRKELRRIPAFFDRGVRMKSIPNSSAIMLRMGSLFHHLLAWDTATGDFSTILARRPARFRDFTELRTPENLDFTYTTFAVAPDGQSVAIATANGEVFLLDVESGEATTLRPRAERLGRLDVHTVSFSPDGKLLVVADRGPKLSIWDMATRSEIKTIEAYAAAFAFSGDGQAFAWLDLQVNGRNREVTVRVSRFPELDQSVAVGGDIPLRAQPGFSAIAFTADGKHVVAGGFYAPEDANNAMYVIDVPPN